MIDKVYKICDKKFYENNIQIIKNELLLNNYPKIFIEKHLKIQIELGAPPLRTPCANPFGVFRFCITGTTGAAPNTKEPWIDDTRV